MQHVGTTWGVETRTGEKRCWSDAALAASERMETLVWWEAISESCPTTNRVLSQGPHS